MTKSDLRSGMMVKTRDGKTAIVMLNTPNGDALVCDDSDEWPHNHMRDDHTYNPLDFYNDDLTLFSGRCITNDADIVKVYGYPFNCDALSFTTKRELLWNRYDDPETSK
jgi:hypothetical protein